VTIDQCVEVCCKSQPTLLSIGFRSVISDYKHEYRAIDRADGRQADAEPGGRTPAPLPLRPPTWLLQGFMMCSAIIKPDCSSAAHQLDIEPTQCGRAAATCDLLRAEADWHTRAHTFFFPISGSAPCRHRHSTTKYRHCALVCSPAPLHRGNSAYKSPS